MWRRAITCSSITTTSRVAAPISAVVVGSDRRTRAIPITHTRTGANTEHDSKYSHRALHTASVSLSDPAAAADSASVVDDADVASASAVAAALRDLSTSEVMVTMPTISDAGRHFRRRGVASHTNNALRSLFNRLDDVRRLLQRAAAVQQQPARGDTTQTPPTNHTEADTRVKLRADASHLLRSIFAISSGRPTAASHRLDSRDYKDIFFRIREQQLHEHAWPFFQLFQLHMQLRWRESKQSGLPNVRRVSARVVGLILGCLAASPRQGPQVAASALEWMMNDTRADRFELDDTHAALILRAFAAAADSAAGGDAAAAAATAETRAIQARHFYDSLTPAIRRYWSHHWMIRVHCASGDAVSAAAIYAALSVRTDGPPDSDDRPDVSPPPSITPSVAKRNYYAAGNLILDAFTRHPPSAGIHLALMRSTFDLLPIRSKQSHLAAMAAAHERCGDSPEANKLRRRLQQRTEKKSSSPTSRTTAVATATTSGAAASPPQTSEPA